MTGNFGGGNYSTTWSLGSSGNMVAGKGWNPGSTTRVVGYNAGNSNDIYVFNLAVAPESLALPDETPPVLLERLCGASSLTEAA